LGALIVRPLVPILAALLLAGCNSWPPPGQGGAAERGRATLPPGTDPALAERLRCALGGFEQVRGAALDAGTLTGRAESVRELALRAEREAAGGLQQDAALSLSRLEAETLALRVQLRLPPAPPPEGCA
jgi:hypothetical protein